MRKYWHTSFYITFLYVLIVFSLQAFMSKRTALRLKTPLTIWNLSLALFSIIGSSRTFPELLHITRKFGFYHSVCHSSFIEITRPSGLWTWLFSLSKVPELGDTIFIVLRKRPLLFLHVYHHVTVLIFTWYTYSDYTAPARWFVDMNYMIHSFMYTYYTLMSIGFRMPKQISMLITTSQIGQMIMGVYVIYYAYARKSQGHPCRITQDTALFGMTMYFSYFVLFALFFYNSYWKTPKKQSIANGVTKSATNSIKQD